VKGPMSQIGSEVVGSGSAGADVQTDNISSFSFSGLHDAALAKMNGQTDTPEPTGGEQVAADVPADAGVVQGDATNVDNASAAQLAQLSDDQLVEVTVDGEQVQMPWKDAKNGVMRQAKFTKEMQALRQEQTQFAQRQQELEQARVEREALVTLLKDERMLQQFLQQQYPHLVQQAQAQAQQQLAQIDPEDIATVGQVEQVARGYAEAVNQHVQNLKQELQNELSTITQTIEDRAATAKLTTEINSTIQGLFKEHPYMEKLVPNADQVLRYEVLKLQPRTPEETLDAFKQVFGGWVDNYKQIVAETSKSQVIQKQKLQANNIQGPGGGQVQPQPQSFKKPDGKLDWDAMRAAALSKLS
jgi:hypothetical protein